jgi:hypothetical protein
MDWSRWILVAFGVVFLACFAVVAVLWCIACIWEFRYEPHRRSFNEGREDARNRLKMDAWWFSEDVTTMNLISWLADGGEVWDVRDKWRDERKRLSLGETVGDRMH